MLLLILSCSYCNFVFIYKAYFILVVYSYHEALREDPSGTTAGFPGPVPMVITFRLLFCVTKSINLLFTQMAQRKNGFALV